MPSDPTPDPTPDRADYLDQPLQPGDMIVHVDPFKCVFRGRFVVSRIDDDGSVHTTKAVALGPNTVAHWVSWRTWPDLMRQRLYDRANSGDRRALRL